MVLLGATPGPVKLPLPSSRAVIELPSAPGAEMVTVPGTMGMLGRPKTRVVRSLPCAAGRLVKAPVPDDPQVVYVEPQAAFKTAKLPYLDWSIFTSASLV